MSTFNARLKEKIIQSKKNLCIAIDPDMDRLPEGYPRDIHGLEEFLRDILNFTQDSCIAYKLNLAFFESLGKDGIILLEKTLHLIRRVEGKLIIADAKRGDIENSSRKYAEAFFRYWNFDAITLNPYMGYDSIKPFLEYRNKGNIVLCLTSNESRRDFLLYGNPPLYAKVAEKIYEWNQAFDNVMAVVGATPEKHFLQEIKTILKGIPVLVPGIGAQGGSLETVMEVFSHGALISVGRSILYASSHRQNLEKAIFKFLEDYYRVIRKHLP